MVGIGSASSAAKVSCPSRPNASPSSALIARHLGDVGAGGEGAAGAGEDQRARVAVGHLDQALGQGAEHGRGEGVQGVRTVQGEERDGSATFEQDQVGQGTSGDRERA